MARSISAHPIRPRFDEECLAPLSHKDCASLLILGALLEGDLPWLARTLADEVGQLHQRRLDPLHRQRAVEVGVLNRRRRAARSFFVQLFQAEIDESFLRTLQETWLPEILSPNGAGPVTPEAARTFLDYASGLLAGALHFDPDADLVATDLLQHALNTAFRRMVGFLGL